MYGHIYKQNSESVLYIQCSCTSMQIWRTYWCYMNANTYFKHTYTTRPLDINLGQPQCSCWYCVGIHTCCVYVYNVDTYMHAYNVYIYFEYMLW